MSIKLIVPKVQTDAVSKSDPKLMMVGASKVEENMHFKPMDIKPTTEYPIM